MPISYSFYQEQYLGSLVPEAAWQRLAQRAGERICADTFGRSLQPHTDTHRAQVALCVCAVAEALWQAQQSPEGSIAKETLGNWSRSYRAPQTAAQQIRAAEQQYLAATGMLYRGCCRGHV